MSLDSIPLTQPPCLSGYNEQGEPEVSSGISQKMCDDIGTNENGNEANEILNIRLRNQRRE